MSDLTGRKQQILRAVVVEYVTYAEPVPSELIVQKYALGVKSATVRNEMAEITELGLLEQPHTSAGRIPSDTGYRYYVDRLIHHAPISESTMQSVREATAEEQTLKDLVVETTKSLSRITQLLSAAEIIRDSGVPVRNAVITALGPDRALLVLILQNGLAENRFIELPKGTTLDEIGKANDVLGTYVSGQTLGKLIKLKLPSDGPPAVAMILKRTTTVIRSLAKDLTKGHLVVDGEEFIVAQPEFTSNPELVSRLIGSLSDEDSIREAMGGPASLSPTVTIGRENPRESLFPLAVVRQTFFVGDDEAGTIALIGPTRMNYDVTVPLLDFTARAISKTLTKILR